MAKRWLTFSIIYQLCPKNALTLTIHPQKWLAFRRRRLRSGPQLRRMQQRRSVGPCGRAATPGWRKLRRVAAFVRREVPENGEEEEGAPQKRKHRYMEGERVPVGVGQDPAKQSAAAEGHASDRRQRCPSAFLVRRNRVHGDRVEQRIPHVQEGEAKVVADADQPDRRLEQAVPVQEPHEDCGPEVQPENSNTTPEHARKRLSGLRGDGDK